MTLDASSMEAGSCEAVGSVNYSTNSARFNSDYGIRAAAVPQDISSYVGRSNFGTISDFWHRFQYFSSGSLFGNGNPIFEYRDDLGVPVVRSTRQENTVMRWEYWDGSAWNVMSPVVPVDGGPYLFEIHIVSGLNGRIEFSVTENFNQEPNILIAEDLDLSHVAGIASARMYGLDLVASHTCEWILGDEPTIGHRYAIAEPTGNGTDTAGSGDFDDVDEASVNDADFSTLSAAGDAETYTHGAMTLPDGVVKFVQMECRLRNQVGGPQNAKGRLRIGGVAHDQSVNFAGIGINFDSYLPRWDTNPAGGNWDVASASDVAVEFGILAQP